MRWRPFGLMAAAIMHTALTGVAFAVPAMGELAPNRHGWSETVGGLRVKAVIDKPAFTLGEDLRLLVMIHNTTHKPIDLPWLNIMPTAGLAEDEHPHGKSHSYNAMVIGRPVDAGMCILWALQAGMEKAEWARPHLDPGEIQVAVIRLTTGVNAEVMMEALHEDDGVIREDVSFSAAVGPGQYELSFLFDTSGLAKDEDRDKLERQGPAVRLQTPPIIVTAREGEPEALELQAERADKMREAQHDAPKNNGWTDAFRGLRLKAVVSDLEFDIGDELVLFVMMQNTTDRRLTIPEPRVTPQTRAPDPPQAGEAERLDPVLGQGFNAQLTAEPAKARAEQRHGGLEPIADKTESVTLEPGGIHVLIIRMTTGQAELMEQGPAHVDVTREAVHLDAATEPGVYGLGFTYAPDGLDGEHDAADSPWVGHRFVCPVIRIEAQAGPDQEDELVE